MGYGGAQIRGPLPVQGLQCGREAVAERGDGTDRELDALAVKVGADLLAPAEVEMAGQYDTHDKVVAVALAGRD